MSETGTIARTSRRPRLTPEQRRRKKILQITVGMLVFVLISILALMAQSANPRGAYIVLIGAALGYVLQRSRFCFTASLRDPVLTGGTNLTKAVIISLAVASFIFMALNMQRFGFGLENFGNVSPVGFLQPVGIHTAIGAFLFGIGAVIAGGCASGTLMRMGEGFVQQWIVIVFFITGTVLGGFLLPLVLSDTAKAVFLPQALGGWLPAFLVHFGLLFVLYIAADVWARRKSGGR